MPDMSQCKTVPDPPMQAESILRTIERLFSERGQANYSGEAVTQTEHALQAAQLAQNENADSALITDALLHDVGHLLHDFGEDCAREGTDDEHERLGAIWLGRYFISEVVEPVRLHVAAKRYRCAVDDEYRSRLSSASVLSLRLQGGPFTQKQAQAFENHPHFSAAIRLRAWDETAKVPGLKTPSVTEYLPDVAECFLADVATS